MGQNCRLILVGASMSFTCILPAFVFLAFHVITEFCCFNCFSFVNCSYRYQIAVRPMMCATRL